MGAAVQQTLIFLVQFIFGLYSFVIVLRIWLLAVGANYNHPFVTGVAKTTTPVVRKLQKFIPDISGIELASVILLLLITLIKLLLMSFIAGHVPNPGGLMAWTLGSAIEVCLDAAFYVMIIMALLSWMPNAQPALYGLLAQMTMPILQPVRKVIPLIAGMDLSPVVLLVVIQVVEMLAINPLVRAGLSAALR